MLSQTIEVPHIPDFSPWADLRMLHLLKHIAIDICDSPPWNSQGSIIGLIAACKNLESISIVLRDVDCNEQDPNVFFYRRFLPPPGHCRLQDVPDQVLGRTAINFDVGGRPHVPPCPVEQFVDWFRKELDGRAALVAPGPPPANGSISAVKIKVQSFVECVETPNLSEEWREPWWQDAEEDTSDSTDEAYGYRDDSLDYGDVEFDNTD
ncbi:hypothetical protein B0T26DRAFT_677695 [Lasiosphaeria miniovina]|uniref:Uncharacterized protein n=1 Tax=Lasiosphaeria miniovina TaxID=1954250 RepID=A0AA40ACH0_9PEZI|nr:uncharacterized protein B0T26DRAFT_677695 [Lasiosphaeria miniovina]KAK0713348.1 hypothetical protein B0T26DRAFT_677695 [Lasiosphaeria miniovina]